MNEFKGIINGILLSIPLWVVIVLIVMLLSGCTYTGRNDPNIQWIGQHKEFPTTTKQRYFSNEMDITITDRICRA